VHTTPPPEFTPSKLLMKADFNGITIPGHYSFGGPGTDCVMLDGPYQGLVIPWRVGANSTPPTMLMSPMLIMYPRAVQDAWLTESALRGYTEVVIAPDGWNLSENNFTMTTDVLTAWAQYLMSWGNRVVLWRAVCQVGQSDPYLVAMHAAGCVYFYICGKEIDGQIKAEQLPPILNQAIADAPGVLMGVHFTAQPLSNPNDPTSKGGGYPIGFPRDTFLAGGATGSWADYNGIVHLCHQACQDNSAGTQGAFLYYTRIRVQTGGGDGGDGRPAPDCQVIVFEQQATNQLFHKPVNTRPELFNDEVYGCLRTLEMLFCPNGGNAGISGLGGFGNGGRYADGSWIQ
jgi:hypothetical protein